MSSTEGSARHRLVGARQLLRCGRRAVLAAAFLGAAGAVATSGALAADPVYTCPAAPSGWTATGGGPQFWGPDQNPGTDLERVSCRYANGKHMDLSVAVNYALPSDLNPFADFDYGCGSNGAVPWSTSRRVYQVTSVDHWLYASLADPYDLLAPADVPEFEQVAKSMVSRAEGLAHSCTLKTAPTKTKAGWYFDFEFDLTGHGVIVFGGIGTHIPQTIPGMGTYAIPDGSFQTKGAASHSAVTKLSAPQVDVTVLQQGRHRRLVIRFVKGVSFRYSTGSTGLDTVASLVAQVRVAHSTVPGCAAGSKGTMTLATRPAALGLDLCGSVFGKLTGHRAQVTIQRA